MIEETLQYHIIMYYVYWISSVASAFVAGFLSCLAYFTYYLSWADKRKVSKTSESDWSL